MIATPSVIASPDKQQIPPLRCASVGMTSHGGANLKKTLVLGIDAEDMEPVGGGVGEVIGWGVLEGVGLQAEGTADAAGAAVAGGEDVDISVADHDGFRGGDGVGGIGVGFGDEAFEAVGVGLFGVKAVAAIVLEEEWREAEVVADVTGGLDGFVGQDGHEDLGVRGTDGFEGFEDAGVEDGVVEFVDAVVVKEECQGFGYIFLVVNVALGVAEGAADEERGSVADVAGDDGFGEFRFAEAVKGGVDGVAEVDAGVDERAVEVKDEKAGRWDERHYLRVIDSRGVSFFAQEATCAKGRLKVGRDGSLLRAWQQRV